MWEIIDQYEKYIRDQRNFSQETINKYVGNLKIIFSKLRINTIDEFKPNIINSRWIDDFWMNIQSGRGLSDSTRASYYCALKSFSKFLYLKEYIDFDISSKIEIPRRRKLWLEGLTNEEQKKLRYYLSTNLKKEKDLRDAALIMFLWGTGCRISEALKLNCHPNSYIYFDRDGRRSGDFHVENNKVYVYIQGKGHKDRVIRVADEIVAYLNFYLHHRKKKNEILFQNIFNPFNEKLRLNRNGANVAINAVFKKCGIIKDKGLASHILRHTAIDYWLENKLASEQQIQMMTGLVPQTLMIYKNRNKKFTDIFGEKSKAIGVLDDPKLKKQEELLRLSHSYSFERNE